jgi:hypothetical protein
MNTEAQPRKWLRYARVAVALVLLLILLPTLTQPQFLSTFAHINLPLAGLAFALSLASVAAKAQRWGIVLRARGVHVTYRYPLTSYFVGLFSNNFLPSGLGGDAVRAYDSAHTTGRGKEAITAVILERGSGMLVAFGGGSLLALFQPNLPLSIALLAHGLFVGALVGLFLLWQDFTNELLDRVRGRVISRAFNGRLDTPWLKFVDLYREFRSYRRERRLLVILLAQALLTQALAILALYTLILALGYAPPFGAFSAVTGIGTSLDLVPISLNSLGVREGVYVYFLGLLAIPGPAAAAFAVSIRLVALLQALLGGFLFLWRGVRPESRSSATLTSSNSTTTPECIARG